MLTKKEITCDIANNGNEAIDMAKNNTYDAILMDIHMPGISGEEATRQIRKFDTVIPIIALTAASLDDSLDSFYDAGCNDVVTKPFKPEVFYQKIGENIFDKKSDFSHFSLFFFDHTKIIFWWDVFLNFISWLKRIVLKRFHSDTNILNVKKLEHFEIFRPQKHLDFLPRYPQNQRKVELSWLLAVS